MSKNSSLAEILLLLGPLYFKDSYRAVLERLEGPGRWKLAKEVAKLTQSNAELIAEATVRRSLVPVRSIHSKGSDRRVDGRRL